MVQKSRLAGSHRGVDAAEGATHATLGGSRLAQLSQACVRSRVRGGDGGLASRQQNAKAVAENEKKRKMTSSC